MRSFPRTMAIALAAGSIAISGGGVVVPPVAYAQTVDYSGEEYKLLPEKLRDREDFLASDEQYHALLRGIVENVDRFDDNGAYNSEGVSQYVNSVVRDLDIFDVGPVRGDVQSVVFFNESPTWEYDADLSLSERQGHDIGHDFYVHRRGADQWHRFLDVSEQHSSNQGYLFGRKGAGLEVLSDEDHLAYGYQVGFDDGWVGELYAPQMSPTDYAIILDMPKAWKHDATAASDAPEVLRGERLRSADAIEYVDTSDIPAGEISRVTWESVPNTATGDTTAQGVVRVVYSDTTYEDITVDVPVAQMPPSMAEQYAPGYPSVNVAPGDAEDVQVDYNDNAPDGETAYTIDDSYRAPEGWTVDVDDKGNVTVGLDEAVEPGSASAIPVRTTYSDGSSDLAWVFAYAPAVGQQGEPGPKGDKGDTGAPGRDGKDGKDGVDGIDGAAPVIGDNGNWFVGGVDTGVAAQGDSAFDIWRAQEGNADKTVEDYIAALVGPKGDNGASAFEVWAAQDGNAGKSVEDFLESLRGMQGERGEKGDTGQSAFDLWLSQPGNEGKSEADFLQAMKGDKGDTGAPGRNGKDGADGKDGVTPVIGDNGNWFVGGVDTGIAAQGDSAFDVWRAQDGNADKTMADYVAALVGPKGDNGASAFEIWASQEGNAGKNVEDFLAAITGPQGEHGADGVSAFEIWRAQDGNEDKTVDDFFAAITGDKGDKGDTGAPGRDGKDGKDGRDGKAGAGGVTPHVGDNGNWFIGDVDTGVSAQGDDAFDIWQAQEGNAGKNEGDFFNALVGPRGDDGKSAYELWLEKNPGQSIDAFFASLQGATGKQGERGEQGVPGADGKSAFEVWKQATGNADATEADFLSAIKGDKGDTGAPGRDGADGKDRKDAVNQTPATDHTGSSQRAQCVAKAVGLPIGIPLALAVVGGTMSQVQLPGVAELNANIQRQLGVYNQQMVDVFGNAHTTAAIGGVAGLAALVGVIAAIAHGVQACDA